MAYNSNAAHQVERVYENDRLKIKSFITTTDYAKAQEKKTNKLALKLVALVLSIGILSSVYVYSYAAVYSTQVEIASIEEDLSLSKSNYTQTLKQFNDIYTQDFVKSYAVENLGFSEYNNSIIYVYADDEVVEIYK